MSRYHANVVWQSPNGTWNSGFFKRLSPVFNEEYDTDDEFSTDEFEWVSIEHNTAEGAATAYKYSSHYPNPGGWEQVDPTDREQAEKFDLMARFYFHPAFAAQYKENQAKNAIQVKTAEIVGQCEQANWYPWDKVTVTIASSLEAAATGFGMFTSHSGSFHVVDSVVMLDDLKIYNKITGEFNKLITRVAPQVTPSRWR